MELFFEESLFNRCRISCEHGTTVAVEVVEMMGSMAVVVLINSEEVVVTNCGDLRAVLCRGGTIVIGEGWVVD